MYDTKIIFGAFLLSLISGCATNAEYMSKASAVMGNNPKCMEIVSRTGVASFNHVATTVVGGKASVSIATDGSNTACGYASSLPKDITGGAIGGWGVTWEIVDQVSLARCEGARAKSVPKIESPCRVFSHNYDVVYGKDDADEK